MTSYVGLSAKLSKYDVLRLVFKQKTKFPDVSRRVFAQKFKLYDVWRLVLPAFITGHKMSYFVQKIKNRTFHVRF